jgi:hypothetical protein
MSQLLSYANLHSRQFPSCLPNLIDPADFWQAVILIAQIPGFKIIVEIENSTGQFSGMKHNYCVVLIGIGFLAILKPSEIQSILFLKPLQRSS